MCSVFHVGIMSLVFLVAVLTYCDSTKMRIENTVAEREREVPVPKCSKKEVGLCADVGMARF